ncbi:MAG: hypothetical protein ACPKPY_04175 [Nitrososphaeraceae archaeon]
MNKTNKKDSKIKPVLHTIYFIFYLMLFTIVFFNLSLAGDINSYGQKYDYLINSTNVFETEQESQVQVISPGNSSINLL